MNRPTLRTSRLILRPFEIADAPRVQQLAGAREVALNTIHIPHPYPDGAAEEWISKHEQRIEEGEFSFAIDDGELVGAIGLHMKRGYERAEIGYWLGVPFWGRGYATEAVAAIIRYGFEELKLNRIYAGYFSRNAASGRVMEKSGMKYEGSLRQHVKKWDEYVDVIYYGILRSEWQVH
ncbi:MAG TPA: GNAT family N-acetyltransferase [Thermoanaerobaculia bacterium]|jgi:RimJ/RimL family protein N-acetyltransferase|nr:GNAT family N-acetyltransferase [Thermoanaerobaculia bacterium]